MGHDDRPENALAQEVAALWRRVAELEHAEAQSQHLLREVQEVSGRLFVAGVRERDLATRADEERARLHALVDAISDEVWFADAAGNIEFINEAVARGLGVEREDALHTPVSALDALREVHTADAEPLDPEQTPLLRSLRGEAVVGFRRRVRHPRTGEWHSQQVTSSPVRDSQGRIVGAVAVAWDTTERDEAEQRLRDNERLTERTSQLRSLAEKLILAEERERQRIARILHDHLQQLLVAGQWRVSSLQGRLTDPSQRVVAEQVHDVLEEAIRTSRSLTAELSPPVLYDVGLTAALHWLARWMDERYGLQVDVDAEDLDKATPEATRALLFHAARELLFNVFKHAGVNRAQVELRRLPDERVELVISDRGKGMGAMQMGHTAEAGFGLFRLRERLDMLGGHMEVHSAPEQGTQFRLRVPEGRTGHGAATGIPTSGTAPAAPEDAEAREGSSAVRVLLVDDHAIVRQSLARLLTDELDIELVGQAGTGHEAIELARATRPDVVLMDVSMPGMDGIEATRRITRDLPGVRVIGLSMYEGAELPERMREAGAVDYVSKGGTPAELVEAVRRQGHPSKE